MNSSAEKKAILSKIKKANDAYRKGEPIMSDQEYDSLLEQFEELGGFLDIIFEKPDESRKQKLPYPMMSLDKIKTFQELESWFSSLGLGENQQITITPKYDGISLISDNIGTWTRGDGEFGENCDAHFQKMGVEIMQEPEFNCYSGEAIISKYNWNEFFKGKINPKTQKPYKSARNTVAGLFNQKTPGAYARSLAVLAPRHCRIRMETGPDHKNVYRQQHEQ